MHRPPPDTNHAACNPVRRALTTLVVLHRCAAAARAHRVQLRHPPPRPAASPAPRPNGVLTVGLLGDIGQPPDPDIYYANNGTAIMINAYEGLVQYKNDTDAVKIAPRLADVVGREQHQRPSTRSTSGTGVTFHDGTPFTSAAVDVAFKRRIAVKGGAAYMVEARQERRDAGRLHRRRHADARRTPRS